MSTTSKAEPGHAAERVEVVVRPAGVGCAGDVPVGAVVGHDHPVLLERLEHDPRLSREARDVEVALQPQARAHRRQRRVGERAREVPCRPDVGPPGPGDGEPQRVVDPSAARPRRSGRGPAGSGARRRPPTSSRPAAAGSSAGSRSRPSRPSSVRRPGGARRARRAGRRRGRRSARAGRRRPPPRPRSARRRESGTARGRTRPRTRTGRRSCAGPCRRP